MAFTYFFRDMQTLETIRNNVIPSLRSRRYIHVWDAGSAMGPEPYSLAITFRENMGPMTFRNVKIHATDIDGSNLFGKIIADGVYPLKQLKRIPGDIFTKYFEPYDRTEQFRITEEIRKSVTYQKHDLLSLTPIRGELGLIVCKNVLLHFNEKERINVIKMFHKALGKDGYFVTEQTQKMPDTAKTMFEPVVSNAQLFRKINP